jgi:hypothetical protein
MNHKLILAHSISLVLLVGLSGCTKNKNKEQLQAEPAQASELDNSPKPNVLKVIKDFLNKQAIDTSLANSELVYPTIYDFYNGSSQSQNSQAKDLRESVCLKDEACNFFFNVGYSYKNGLNDEIKEHPVLAEAVEKNLVMDLESTHSGLQTALGVQPYRDNVLKAYKQKNCDIECKDYIYTGMRVVLGISKELNREAFQRMNENAQEVLGRTKKNSKRESNYLSLESTTKQEYKPAIEYKVSNERAKPIHSYHEKIQMQAAEKSVKRNNQEVELVPNATGITENRIQVSNEKTSSYVTYGDKLSDMKESEGMPKQETTVGFNIVDRKPKQLSQDNEYIVIN